MSKSVPFLGICPVCQQQFVDLMSHLRKQCFKNAEMAELKKIHEEVIRHCVNLTEQRITSLEELVSLSVTDDHASGVPLIDLKDVVKFFQTRGFRVRFKNDRGRMVDVSQTDSRDAMRIENLADRISCLSVNAAHETKSSIAKKSTVRKYHKIDGRVSKRPTLKQYSYPECQPIIDEYEASLHGCAAKGIMLRKLLYFVNQKDAQLAISDMLDDAENVLSYFRMLRTNNYSMRTVSRYQMALFEFLTFLSIFHRDRFDAGHINTLSFLQRSVQHWLSNSRTVFAKQERKQCEYDRIFKSSEFQVLTPRESTAVLRLARNDVIEIAKRAAEEQLIDSDIGTLVGYLWAVIVLKHCHRVSVASNLKCEEWKKRRQITEDGVQYTIVGVVEHKTSAHQLALICFGIEEASLMETYFDHVRPLLAERCTENSQFFFLSLNGKQFSGNKSHLVTKLQKEFNVPRVLNRQARTAMETAIRFRYDDAEGLIINEYLTHSRRVSNDNYVKQNARHSIGAYKLIRDIDLKHIDS